jgi:hypothetical protein
MMNVNLVENILNVMDYQKHLYNINFKYEFKKKSFYFEVQNQLKQLLQLKDVNIQVDYREVKIILKLFHNVMKLKNVNVFDEFYFP